MPLVQAKCESCGGNLTVDSNLKAANCPFCGTAYVVQDAINHYNTSVTIEHLHADVVNISDESSSEGRLRAADALMKMNKYGEAEREYLTVTRLAPQNYRGWYGLIESHPCRFSRRLIKRSEFNMLNDYIGSRQVYVGERMTHDTSKALIVDSGNIRIIVIEYTHLFCGKVLAEL